MKEIVALLCLLAFASADAQQKPDAAIRYRQGLMAAMDWNFQPLAAMTRGRTPFDAKEFALRTERLAAYGPQLLEGFPKGSDKGGVTDAGAAIWKDFAGFTAKVNAYIAESNKLAESAKTGDEVQMKTQLRKVDDACKSCHDAYKAD